MVACAQVKEVPGFRQEDLFSQDIMILDSFQEVFLWLGSAVPEAERKEAFGAGLVSASLCVHFPCQSCSVRGGYA